jgi:hypothetical protein
VISSSWKVIFPLRGLENPGDAVEEGCLSRTVRTDDPVDLPLLDLHVHFVQRLEGSEIFA